MKPKKPDSKAPNSATPDDIIAACVTYLKLAWLSTAVLVSVAVIGGGLMIGGHRGVSLLMQEWDLIQERGTFHHRKVETLLVSHNYRDTARVQFDFESLEVTDADAFQCPVTVWAAPYPGEPYEELQFVYWFRRYSWHRCRIELLPLDDPAVGSHESSGSVPSSEQ